MITKALDTMPKPQQQMERHIEWNTEELLLITMFGYARKAQIPNELFGEIVDIANESWLSFCGNLFYSEDLDIKDIVENWSSSQVDIENIDELLKYHIYNVVLIYESCLKKHECSPTRACTAAKEICSMLIAKYKDINQNLEKRPPPKTTKKITALESIARMKEQRGNSNK